jgi:anti-sigma factor RsiW
MTECGRSRRLLWPDNGPRSATPEVIEAQEHVEGCASCTAFFEEMRRLSDDVRRAVPQTVAPFEVRDRLFKAISRARAETGSRFRLNAALVAAAASAVILLLLFGIRSFSRDNPSEPRSLIPVLAEEHARALGEAGIRSSDAAEISRWLNGRLSFATHVPVFSEAALRGARVLEVRKRRGALIEYAIGKVLISYFIVADQPAVGTSSVPALEETVWDGYHVVTWTEAGLLHAFVGDVSESELRLLAQKCIEQAGSMMAAFPESELDQARNLSAQFH